MRTGTWVESLRTNDRGLVTQLSVTMRPLKAMTVLAKACRKSITFE